MKASASRTLLRALASTSALVALAGAAHAEGQSAADDAQVETIVVTARKRTETVQEVPATVGVVSAEKLAASGAANLTQLPSLAPGLNLTSAPTSNEYGVTIRGLGSSPGDSSFDSSVSLFVDGVYAPRNREFAASMFDIERVEVVRGTQAALLGKNTSLGAINLITRKPGSHLGGELRVAREFEMGSTLVSGGADLPASDTLALRIAGQYLDKDGATFNSLTGKNAVRLKDRALRGVVLWRPDDRLEVTTTAQYDQVDNHGSPAEFIATDGAPELLQALAGAPATIETRLDRRNAQSLPSNGGEQGGVLSSTRYSTAVKYSLGAYELTAISGYARMASRSVDDLDFLAGDYLVGRTHEVGKQLSQEVRLSSPVEDRFSYLIGLLYLDGNLVNNSQRTANYPIGPAPGVTVSGAFQQAFDQKTKAVSIFGNAIFQQTDKLQYQLGLRWTKEDKDVDLARTASVPGFFSLVLFPAYAPFSQSRSEDSLDYSLGVKYQLNADANLYASYGQGTKSGGFASSVTRLDQSAYLNEVAHTAEVGFKLNADDRRWVLNAALFDTRVDDFQLVTFTGLQFEIGNTNLRSRGAELEGYWRPVRGLRLALNTTYAEAADEETGRAPPLAPRWSGGASASYTRPVDQALELRAEAGVDFRSKRYYQQNASTSPPGRAFTPVNASLALAAPEQGWEIRLIGRNLFDERAMSFAFPTAILGGANQNGMAEEPRTVALQLSLKR